MSVLESLIRNVQDFPKPGIGFKDITTLIKDGSAFREAVTEMGSPFLSKGVDLAVGIEARGFIFAAALAYAWDIGVIPVRKPGKLPAATLREEYALEYGTDAVEIHKDALQPGQNILILDDLLATGGTVAATSRLIERLGGNITGISFLVELAFLKGRDKISDYEVHSVIIYD